MWKRWLIAAATFLAGLYFFLEFILPPINPITKRVGVVATTTETAVTVNKNNLNETVPITLDTVILRKLPDGTQEEISVSSVKPGDQIEIGNTTYLTKWITQFGSFFIIIGAMAWGMGLISLFMVHSTTIRKMRPDWIASIFFFFAVAFGIVGGYGYGMSTTKIEPEQITNAEAIITQLTTSSDPSVIFVYSQFSENGKLLISQFKPGSPPSQLLKKTLANELNKLVEAKNLYDPERFKAIVLPVELQRMTKLELYGDKQKKFNRQLLDVIFISGLQKGSSFFPYANEIVVDKLLSPMGSTVFSLLAFYMVSAAYRAFRLKSREAFLMMLSSIIIMLGQIPIGMWLTKSLPEWAQITTISSWLLYTVNTAAVRGMFFGMMVGAIAVGLRFWLSLERGAFFDREL